MDNLHDILTEIEQTNEDCVLATVVKVEGSAYRKEGTSMLFKEGGGQTGVISGGCLETDLALQAERLFKTENTQSTLVYDMRAEDDLSWGRGAGCNGKIHILLERIDFDLKKDLLEAKRQLDRGIHMIALKVWREGAIHTMFVSEKNHIFGSMQPIPSQFIRKAQKQEKSHIVEGADNIFIHHIQPKPKLLIFGAGPDVQPVAGMANQTGFSVHIWDWRPAYLKQADFPDADLLQHVSVEEAIRESRITNSDSVIIMTHDFQKDREILHALHTCEYTGYLGILGPRKRTLRLLESKNMPEHIHTPIGLDIGAEGPEEIAISIIAELIETQRKKERTQATKTKFEKRTRNEEKPSNVRTI